MMAMHFDRMDRRGDRRNAALIRDEMIAMGPIEFGGVDIVIGRNPRQVVREGLPQAEINEIERRNRQLDDLE